MNFKKAYTEKMNSIGASDDFCENTVELIRQTVRRKENIYMKRKPIKILAVAIAIVALFSVSAYAISSMLSAGDVAKRTGFTEISDLFDTSVFEEQTISDENYTVTLHGVASGKRLDFVDGTEAESDRSYLVASIAKNDGTSLSVLDGAPLQLSPLVSGLPSWKVNAWSLGTSAHGIEQDGVLYYLFDIGSLEIFADRTVYIAAYEGFAPNTEVFTMKDNGEFAFNENYDGFKALFTLELDEAKADPKAVEEFISKLYE